MATSCTDSTVKPAQVPLYALGCVLFSMGAKCFIDSQLGVDPLDVLCIGMTKHLPFTIGIAAGVVAAAFLMVWSTWNRKWPPLMPFVTTFLVGNLIDLWNYLRIDHLTTRALPPYPLLLVALLMCSYASSLIIMSGIGIRIMDLVAITMVERLGWSFFKGKMSLEILMFAMGLGSAYQRNRKLRIRRPGWAWKWPPEAFFRAHPLLGGPTRSSPPIAVGQRSRLSCLHLGGAPSQKRGPARIVGVVEPSQ